MKSLHEWLKECKTTQISSDGDGDGDGDGDSDSDSDGDGDGEEEQLHLETTQSNRYSGPMIIISSALFSLSYYKLSFN